ncbi:hypothetical protein N8I77_011430 [Diaporthe amygdali]|uniref:Cutinase n=1 Tax=Phomopsis amygdali TaxID=1214568 RepID=A0AAD9S5E7_PHOAM|nr:hypothetical protein N8I77_011430 [Diaporthe amygdali]
MHYQALLVAYFSATAAGLPLFSKNTRQSLPGLGSGTGTGTGIPSLPSGLPGLGGDGTGSGILPIPSGLLGGLGGSGTGSGSLPIPTGLLGGLGGGSGTPALPTGLPGLGGDSTGSGLDLSGLLGGTSTGTSDTAADTADTSTSANTAAAAADCNAVTVIFARGTTEAGTLGSVVGPGLQKALGSSATVTGVAYAADAGGIATEISPSGGAGTQAMVKAVQSALSSCPDTQIVLSGYSQGAMLVHNTMNNLASAQAGKVKAAVTFGDPFVGQAVKGIPDGAFKSYCASGDTVCSSGVASSPSSGGTTSASAMGHLGYGSDTSAAATFIKSKVAA